MPTTPNKSNENYVNSLDKIFFGSRFTGKEIADKMGMTYHEIALLSRLKTLPPEILDLCKRAARELAEGNNTPWQQKYESDIDDFCFKPSKNSTQRVGTEESPLTPPEIEFRRKAEEMKKPVCTDKPEASYRGFRSVARGEKVVIPNPFDTEMWRQPQNIVPMPPTIQDKFEKAAYLLGISSVLIAETKEHMERINCPMSEASEKMFMRLTTGIEELFYKDK